MVTETPSAAPLPDLVTILEGAGTFTYLITALNATDLLGALTSPAGPYTVFAPLDAAFEAFPPAIVDALLTPAFAELLSGVLLYHVVPGIYTPADLFDGMNITTLAEEPIMISVVNESISVNGIPVVGSDILASNGVLYPIDGILLPPGFDISMFMPSNSTNVTAAVTEAPTEAPTVTSAEAPTATETEAPSAALTRAPSTAPLPDLVTTLEEAGTFNFRHLITALNATNLVGALSPPAGPYTVFAPLDSAFQAFPSGVL
jgi:uncharacterized surface protein with fasciclin (FAS1) repeats